jgi:hypothetical protein
LSPKTDHSDDEGNYGYRQHSAQIFWKSGVSQYGGHVLSEIVIWRLFLGKKALEFMSKETHKNIIERREKVSVEKLLSIFKEFSKH